MLGLATALNSSGLKKKSALTNKFSAEFDGTSDYIDVSILSSDLNKDSGTISMWVRVQATSGNESFFNCSAVFTITDLSPRPIECSVIIVPS